MKFGMVFAGDSEFVTLYTGVGKTNAAFAHVCYVNRIPFLSVRTVTDNGKQSGEAAFEENVEKASAISAGLCLELIGSL